MGTATSTSRLYTIGHSNHSWERFVQLLGAAGITAVLDVRSSPFSRRLAHFNRPELERGLRSVAIAYFFLGEQLGGRPDQPGVYAADGRVDYERVRTTTPFRDGIEYVLRSLHRYTLALLCAEEDPLECHRGLMIAPALVEQGLVPIHLRGDGREETTAETERRLLAETGVGTGITDGLFAAALTEDERSQMLAEAYRAQARRKAFRLSSIAGANSQNDWEVERDATESDYS